MPNPSIPNFNGQIKTPWRGGYTSAMELAENSLECRSEMNGCGFQLICKPDSLMPFQFVRPFSMSAVTSWGLYDSSADDAALLVDLTDQIDKLSYYATTLNGGGSIQYITYPGTALDSALPSGVYYMRIVSGGITYHWEPLRIVCDHYGVNVFPENSFEYFLHSDNSTDSGWDFGGNTARRVINTPGAPSNPVWEVEGYIVINTGDNALYTYTSGSWVQDLTPDTRPWYDFHTGSFYRFVSGAWAGIVAPITVQDDGICWNGNYDAMLYYDMSLMECIETQVRIDVTVEGMTQGALTVEITDDGGGSVDIDADGVHSFTSYIGDGYLLELSSSGGFDGCVTKIEVFCMVDMDNCFSRLTWTNCGNVGNTYMGGGFTHQFWLDRAIYPVTPNPEVIINEKEQADGSVLVESRRKETTWTIQMGFVPWFIADALSEIALYDEVRLHTVGGGNDRLAQGKTRVQVDWLEDYGECMADVTITFQIDSATVACCDDFDPPCLTSCGNVRGVSDQGGLVEGLVYAISNASEYGTFDDPGFSGVTECQSGIITVVDDEDLIVYTLIFDLNLSLWRFLAQVTDIEVVPNGDGCDVVIQATIKGGYAGILQYLDADDVWQDDAQVDLSAADWLTNTIRRETPADEGSGKKLRIRVYIDDCTIGYSEVSTYACD